MNDIEVVLANIIISALKDVIYLNKDRVTLKHIKCAKIAQIIFKLTR